MYSAIPANSSRSAARATKFGAATCEQETHESTITPVRCAITLDIDWAPDAAIDATADLLRDKKVPATWFVTHRSPAVDRLAADPDLFELGIHPNFLSGSTHGSAPADVLRHCMELVPEARAMRTHALVQSTPILEQVLTTTPIAVDVSLFLPRATGLDPVDYQWKGHSLLRVPYFWEDDVEMVRHCPSWDPAPLLDPEEDLRVFAFHPIHVALNSADMEPYEALKRSVQPLQAVSPSDLAKHTHHGSGSGTLFRALVNLLEQSGEAVRICDIHREWSNTNAAE